MAQLKPQSCFTLDAQELKIAHGDDKRYWKWIQVEDPCSGELVDAAELIKVCYLDVRGEFDTCFLEPGTCYEVAFVIKKMECAEGWECPVKLGLTIPHEFKEERLECFSRLPTNKWKEVPVGLFVAPCHARQMEIYLSGSEDLIWKKRIIIEKVKIYSKNN
ncbi:Phloem protein 2-like protein [Melia azedarach]|uniref:Phloem protein 2-like protein n=2 Tax=Melia azedarach TaxID=155640 RepID=A0ACC1WU11_MELAZ|nr:Phloem protein 2-like protein [Melia azedarach]KAJ4702543.1 Phloem protein 2-like protein [Melia azedarach]